MSDAKKRRLSILDGLAAAGSAAPTPSSMMGTNRALRSARDAVDGHHIWDLDPSEIDDTRYKDRLDPSDVADLRASVEANGQTVPILVRRNPADPSRYLLVYGRRRLEAIRGSTKVEKVRALIANLDEDAALRAQVAENTARRDLSYIERALFAQELLDTGFGTQSQIAEVLNSTKSAISMALGVVKGIGTELAQAIGPAQGVGRPRWEALLAAIDANAPDLDQLIEAAEAARGKDHAADVDPSVAAFVAVARLAGKPKAVKSPAPPSRSARKLTLNGSAAGKVNRTDKGLKLELTAAPKDFLDWLEQNAPDLVEEWHARWAADHQ